MSLTKPGIVRVSLTHTSCNNDELVLPSQSGFYWLTGRLALTTLSPLARVFFSRGACNHAEPVKTLSCLASLVVVETGFDERAPWGNRNSHPSSERRPGKCTQGGFGRPKGQSADLPALPCKPPCLAPPGIPCPPGRSFKIDRIKMKICCPTPSQKAGDSFSFRQYSSTTMTSAQEKKLSRRHGLRSKPGQRHFEAGIGIKRNRRVFYLILNELNAC